MAEPRAAGPTRGFVSLVGAGPGDPGLMTLRGRRAIELADVVLYDHLASPSVLAAVDVPGQERIHVGKAGGVAFSSQEAINDLLVRRARAGQRVVRLKGGEPFVFGRGAEEAEALAAAGIAFEIVPGVTSAHAVPAAAGIPVTHRDLASSFTVVTGHEKDDGAAGGVDSQRIDWTTVGQDGGTVVVLMGVAQVARWSDGLVRGGRAPSTPVAFVRWGTLARQAVVVTTLGEATAAARGLKAPVVAVVGEVVRLREVLMWREKQPLMGQVIGLTREADDESSFEALEELGAALYHLPLRASSRPQTSRTLTSTSRPATSPTSSSRHRTASTPSAPRSSGAARTRAISRACAPGRSARPPPRRCARSSASAPTRCRTTPPRPASSRAPPSSAWPAAASCSRPPPARAACCPTASARSARRCSRWPATRPCPSRPRPRACCRRSRRA
ncbi:MAG: uroporphyrinogen-III C-methyltransferase [Myxococcota bacterium]